MELILAAIFLAIASGCTIRTGPQYKCDKGVIYIKDDGAWIQAKMYESNKCLPIESDPAQESK